MIFEIQICLKICFQSEEAVKACFCCEERIELNESFVRRSVSNIKSNIAKKTGGGR